MKVKNNYIGAESIDSYVLFDENGTKVATTTKNIVDFNNKYIKTTANNLYYVTDYSGKEIDSTGYLHLTLEEDYYVVVTNDKKLNIKEYDNKDFSLENLLDLETEDYSNAYKVGKNSIGYLITITKTGKVIQVDKEGKVVG